MDELSKRYQNQFSQRVSKYFKKKQVRRLNQKNEFISQDNVSPYTFPDDPVDYRKKLTEAWKPANNQKVISIIGAGCSGLLAARELLKMGHLPIVFEASDRIGGRLFSKRTKSNKDVYYEMGAMRIPTNHLLVQYLIQDFQLKVQQFKNPGNTQANYYVGGELIEPEVEVPVMVKKILKKWDKTIAVLRDKMKEVWDNPNERKKTWHYFVEKYKNHSFRDFLVEQNWTEEEIELFATIGFGVGGYGPLYQICFVEILRISVCDWEKDQVELVGGVEKLSNALYSQPVKLPDGTEESLESLNLVKTNTKVVSIDEDVNGQLYLGLSSGDYFRTDKVILTCTLRALQMEIDIQHHLFSEEKWQAIYNIHYISSAKVFLHLNEEFWKHRYKDFATTITDLPIRGCYFFEQEKGKSGVLCISYTWGDDAVKWAAGSTEENIELAIRQFEQIYGKDTIRPYVIEGDSINWENEPGYRGAFMLNYPGQLMYYQNLAKPENNIYLAGDTISYAGGWIEGALQSAVRVVDHISREETSA